MRVTLLGTQGWIPTEGRETTCFAVEDDHRLLVFDAGTGLSRLVAPPWRSLVERCEEVHLFLTHYHLDHVCGLAYLPAVFPERRVTVYAPHESVTGVDPHDALSGLIRPPYNPRTWRELPGVEVRALREGVSRVAGHRIVVRAQAHSDVSVAYRLDDALVVATDKTPDSATADFAAGADVLLHEAWYHDDLSGGGVPAAQRAGLAAHSEALAVARLAAAAGVRHLILVHLNPLLDEAAYAAMAAAAREVFAATAVYPDGTVLELGGGAND
jgi:ribonuclease BN (tRNA processing enzyme)